MGLSSAQKESQDLESAWTLTDKRSWSEPELKKKTQVRADRYFYVCHFPPSALHIIRCECWSLDLLQKYQFFTGLPLMRPHWALFLSWDYVWVRTIRFEFVTLVFSQKVLVIARRPAVYRTVVWQRNGSPSLNHRNMICYITEHLLMWCGEGFATGFNSRCFSFVFFFIWTFQS